MNDSKYDALFAKEMLSKGWSCQEALYYKAELHYDIGRR